MAKGKKHLSKTEEAERRSHEARAETPKTAKPPKWLPESLKKDFRALGKKLISAGIYTDLDADTLGRYLVVHHQWLIATGEAENALTKTGPTGHPVPDLEEAEAWGRVQDRYFKQARNCANDLGLTVTSRCKLVIPEAAKQSTEENNPFLTIMTGGLARDA